MGFFTNYEKANTELLAKNLLQSITYHSQGSGDLSISALFNVKEEAGENYIAQVGNLGVFTSDVNPVPGDSFTDSETRLWYVEGFQQQKGAMIFVKCYSNNEAFYKE